MTYLIKDPSEIAPRKHMIVDLVRFGHDLAAALGWSIVLGEHGRVDLNSPDEKLALHLHNQTWSPAKASKVNISVSVTDIPFGDQPSVAHSPKYELPSATVSADRPMDSIVRDVKRRVIEAAAEPAEHRRQYAALCSAERGGLKATMQRMKALFGDNIRFNEAQASNHSCPFSWYYRAEGVNSPGYGKFYIDGRVNSDGNITVDRMPNITIGVMNALITAALTAKEIR
jgi:hypothetical protein